MKIVHVVEPFASGISTFLLQLVTHIDGHEHIIVHGTRDEGAILQDIQELFPERVTFIRWTDVGREIHLKNDFRAYKQLKVLFRQIRPDIVHLHSSKAGILGRIAAYKAGFRNVIYTPNAIAFLRTDVGFIHKTFYKVIERIANVLPGKVVSSSSGEHSILKKAGIQSSLIHNGVDFSDYAFAEKPTIQIITCGRITIQKNPAGFNTIAKAFVGMPQVQFTWIGSGELTHFLDAPNITITGWLQQSEVKEHMRGATIYLSTSYWEGLSLASLEALSAGLPMVLSDCCGNDDLIDNDRNGFIFTSETQAIEGIMQLINNPALLMEQSVYARKLYESRFTGKQCATNYLEFYTKQYNGK